MGFFGRQNICVTRILNVCEVNLEHLTENTVVRSHVICFKMIGASCHTAGDDVALLNENSLLYIPPDYRYTVEIISPGPSIAVHFDCTPDTTPEAHFRLFTPAEPEQTGELFRRMLALSKRGLPGDRCTVTGMLYELFGSIENGMLRASPNGADYERIKPALDLMSERLSDPSLCETELAAECGYSAGYFRKLFVRCMDMPPSDYLTKRRMERAGDLLRCGLFSVSQTAAQVGYANVSYFSAVFRRTFGVTPGEWKKCGGAV